MTWTETARRQYERRNSRYASDLTDVEWSIIEPLMPASKHLGRPRKSEQAKLIRFRFSVVLSAKAQKKSFLDFANGSVSYKKTISITQNIMLNEL